jgi:hypothetical protein
LFVGGGTVPTAVATVTTWFIFTTVVVNWPLLIAGLTVGVVLSWIGVANLANLRRDLQSRFQERLLPHLREAVVGSGVQNQGRTIPSIKSQLQQQVRGQAAAACRRFDQSVTS